MKNYNIQTTQNFEEEFRDILYYISSILKEPIISKKLYSKIINKLLSLNIFPERYTLISYNENIRKLLIDNFVIIYQVDISSNQIFILHIFHNSQDYLNLL